MVRQERETMHTVGQLCEFLDSFAPPELAAEWDNVGLLVGDRAQRAERVMTCLTITPAAAAEAIRERADLIVTHHPLPFRPLKKLTADEPGGRILLDLIRAGIAIHSPHTAFDSAARGINQQLAEGLGLVEIEPLESGPHSGPPHRGRTDAPPVPPLAPALAGTGRYGRFPQPTTLGQAAAKLKQFLHLGGLHVVGNLQAPIERVAIACGSAGDLLRLATLRDCQLFITGEASLHSSYDAAARGIAMLLAGHYASERFGVERLAEIIGDQFPALTIWPSQDERDPLIWV
jgi:dinuclear metal center YbgI/SA1388 family protein